MHQAKTTESFLMALVDDDVMRRNGLRQRLDALGHASLAFDSPEDLLAVLRMGRRFACVVVALQGEAFQFQLENILNMSRAPMLFVTLQDNLGALSDLGESLLASESVDAVPLSCSDRELAWRLQLLMQRTDVLQASDDDDLVWRGYCFETRRRLVWLNEQKVSLKPLEFELAIELFRHMNLMVTRERLCAILWVDSSDSAKSRKLDVCVSNIRKKLRIGPESGLLLRSVYGRGYELRATGP